MAAWCGPSPRLAAMNGLRRLLDRAVFQPNAARRPDRLLGLVVLALVALGAWLILWPFIPPLVARLVVALLDLLGWIWSALAAIPWPRFGR